jgi:hypothetical protein
MLRGTGDKMMKTLAKFGLIVAAVSLVLAAPAFASNVPVPEPAMFGMLATGIGAVAALRGLVKR